ncbi:MAG TPA: DUF711 family protein [Ktedonobacteraceae bacterium]|jgi:hypothetical protein
MPDAPIRTITLGLGDRHPLPVTAIQRAARFLQQAQKRFTDAGYEVQTIRLSTRPVLDNLAAWSTHQVLQYVSELQDMLNEVAIEHCSLGPAQVYRPDFPVERLDTIADMLIAAPSANATVQLAGVYQQQALLRQEAALASARVIQRLSRETTEGFGNFRFAVLAHVTAGGPFFPAGYHEGEISTFALGLQGASLVTNVIAAHQSTTSSPLDLTSVTQWIYEELMQRKAGYEEIAQNLAQEHQIAFKGIDYSPAPLGEDSVITAIEQCGYGLFGSSGTLAVVAAFTSALKRLTPLTPGYNGIMLPVLEDAVLGRRWAQGYVDIQRLLLYSSVCGTGLDTIPLPGDMPVEMIARILLDVATLAQRLSKPLSARLFPVPGKGSGESTTFTSPYLTNTSIMRFDE